MSDQNQANIWDLPGYEKRTVAFLALQESRHYGAFTMDTSVGAGVGVDPLGGLWVRNGQPLDVHAETPEGLGNLYGHFAVVWARARGYVDLYLPKTAYGRILQLDGVPGAAWRKVHRVHATLPSSEKAEEVPVPA